MLQHFDTGLVLNMIRLQPNLTRLPIIVSIFLASSTLQIYDLMLTMQTLHWEIIEPINYGKKLLYRLLKHAVQLIRTERPPSTAVMQSGWSGTSKNGLEFSVIVPDLRSP